MKKRGDHFGTDNPNAKLNDEEIREIRLLREQGLTLNRIAEIYNVSKSTISLVSRKLNWKHVSDNKNPTYFGVVIGGKVYKVERNTKDVDTPLITDIPRVIADMADFIFDLRTGNVIRSVRGVSLEILLAKEALKWPLIIEDNI